jgi:hypothetical protein
MGYVLQGIELLVAFFRATVGISWVSTKHDEMNEWEALESKSISWVSMKYDTVGA